MNIPGILKDHYYEMKKKFRVKKMGLFGSCARGEQNTDSDIDILVDFEHPTFDNFINLLFYCEDLLGRSVDLITEKNLSPYINLYVEKEILWFDEKR
jgi:predicted nucleotidyltransferase